MANHRSLSEKQEREVVSMYVEERMSVASIARRMGVHYETTKSILRRGGVDLRQRGQGQFRKSSMTRVRAAVDLYASGEGCEAVAEKFKVTSGTVLRWVRSLDVPVRPMGFQTGSSHHGWVGGRPLRSDGYVQMIVAADDPLYVMAQRKPGTQTRYALEHRLVMARSLGRPLRRNETVHHIDGNKQNNDISNLQLRQGRHGKGVVLVCADCGSCNIQHSALPN